MFTISSYLVDNSSRNSFYHNLSPVQTISVHDSMVRSVHVYTTVSPISVLQHNKVSVQSQSSVDSRGHGFCRFGYFILGNLCVNILKVKKMGDNVPRNKSVLTLITLLLSTETRRVLVSMTITITHL